MANLTIPKISLVRADPTALLTAPVGEAGTAGMYYRQASTGKLEKGNATTTGELGQFGGFLLKTVSAVNMTGTIVMLKTFSIIDLHGALDALAIDALVYVSNTDATWADAAGTQSRVGGVVIAGFSSSTSDKLLLLI